MNRDALTNRIGELVNEKVLEGISHVNNESNNKEGTRLVIDLKRDAIANVIINQLYKLTDLQTSYGINNVAIVKGRPKTLNLKELIAEFVEFRHEVIVPLDIVAEHARRTDSVAGDTGGIVVADSGPCRLPDELERATL